MTVRGEGVIKQLLVWYQRPENWRKTLKQAAEELGISYDQLRQYVHEYGSQRFREEKENLIFEVLREATDIAIARLHQMLQTKSDKKFLLVQAEVRQWYRTIFGEKHQHDVGNRLGTVLEALVELRRKYDRGEKGA